MTGRSAGTGAVEQGVMVPPELCKPLARLAILGARAITRETGGLALGPGLPTLLAQLGSIAGETPFPTLSSATGKWLPVGQVAATHGYSNVWLRALARRGTVRARRVGRIWLVDEESAADYLASRRTSVG